MYIELLCGGALKQVEGGGRGGRYKEVKGIGGERKGKEMKASCECRVRGGRKM